MAVPAGIISAYRVYTDAMYEGYRKPRPVQRFLGGDGGEERERLGSEFVSALSAAVEDLAARDPAPEDAADTVRYILSQAAEHRDNGPAFWMLMASHDFALALIGALRAEDARAIGAEFEAAYPRRERMPVQQAVLRALRAREEEK